MTHHCSTPSLTRINSPKATHVLQGKTYSSSGHLQIPHSLHFADTSTSSLLESGYSSLNVSSTGEQLQQCLKSSPEHLQADLVQGKKNSMSCPTTPQHSVTQVTSTLLPANGTGLKSLGAASNASSDIFESTSGKNNGSSQVSFSTNTNSPPCNVKYTATQVHMFCELETVPEDDSPDEKFNCSNTNQGHVRKEIDNVLVKLKEVTSTISRVSKEQSLPKTASREVQSDNIRVRGWSDSKVEMFVQKKPMLGKTQKSLSEGDLVSKILTSFIHLYQSYLSLLCFI